MDSLAVFGWLLLAAGLQLLSFGRWMTPLAPWLAPVFLLHFAHNMPPLAGALWVWLALAIALGISLRGIVPIPGLAYLVLPVAWGLFGALPFAIDKLVAPLVPGFGATLVLPVAWTALEFLDSRVNPYGTWGATGYTQHGVLPLVQLASVTGVWGIGFIIAWFAAVVNWAWDQQFVWGAGITSAILLIGGLRVALAPDRETVRVAGIGWPKGIIEPGEFMRIVQPGLEQDARDKLNVAFKRIQEQFLESATYPLATFTPWSLRTGMPVPDEMHDFTGMLLPLPAHPRLLAVAERDARAIARECKVYLLMGIATLYPDARYTFRNHAVLLTPTGDTAYDYTKITAVPGFEKKYSAPGDKPIAFADTEFGRIASPICYEAAVPRMVRRMVWQNGKKRVDLLVNPTNDGWYAGTAQQPQHLQIATLRSIETRTPMVRSVNTGISAVVDSAGRTAPILQ